MQKFSTQKDNATQLNQEHAIFFISISIPERETFFYKLEWETLGKKKKKEINTLLSFLLYFYLAIQVYEQASEISFNIVKPSWQ